MNTTVLFVTVIMGLLAEFLVGSQQHLARRIVKVGEIGLTALFFGFITPNDYTLIAIGYVVCPAALRLIGVHVSSILDDKLAAIVAAMYLDGQNKIDPLSILRYLGSSK